MFYHIQIDGWFTTYFQYDHNLESTLFNFAIPYLKANSIILKSNESIHELLYANIRQIDFFESSEKIKTTIIKDLVNKTSEKEYTVLNISNKYLTDNHNMITNKYMTNITNNIFNQAKEKLSNILK